MFRKWVSIRRNYYRSLHRCCCLARLDSQAAAAAVATLVPFFVSPIVACSAAKWTTPSTLPVSASKQIQKSVKCRLNHVEIVRQMPWNPILCSRIKSADLQCFVAFVRLVDSASPCRRRASPDRSKWGTRFERHRAVPADCSAAPETDETVVIRWSHRKRMWHSTNE